MDTIDPLSVSLLHLEQAMDRPEVHDLAGGQAAVFTTARPGKERANEDAAALFAAGPASAVFMVADGVGGTRAGRQASSAVVRELARHVQRAFAEGTGLRPAILDGIEQANHRVMALGVGAATTLAVVEIEEGIVRPYHVGDSTVLLLGQRGRVKLQTIDHSPVGFAREAGMLDEEEALAHEERHVVSNVVGIPEMRIEVGAAVRMAPRDTLLLATDGLMDNLRIEEITARLCTGNLPRAAAELAAAARARMVPGSDPVSKPDDLTFIAFRRAAARRGSFAEPDSRI